jgi:hypothetical protein
MKIPFARVLAYVVLFVECFIVVGKLMVMFFPKLASGRGLVLTNLSAFVLSIMTVIFLKKRRRIRARLARGVKLWRFRRFRRFLTSKSVSPEWINMNLPTQWARRHHYIFAHKALPALFFHDPERFLNALSRDGSRMLSVLWKRVGDDLVESDRMEATGLDFEVHTTTNRTTIGIIKLPTAERITEAYFVAAAYRPATVGGEILRRVLTLEYVRGLADSEPKTVLCEWLMDGNHRNLGHGTDPRLGAFAQKVRRMVEADLSVHNGSDRTNY